MLHTAARLAERLDVIDGLVVLVAALQPGEIADFYSMAYGRGVESSKHEQTPDADVGGEG